MCTCAYIIGEDNTGCANPCFDGRTVHFKHDQNCEATFLVQLKKISNFKKQKVLEGSLYINVTI